MTRVIQSAGGIVYYIDKTLNRPRFLIIKRFALSKKIEWVAPKGKIQKGEKAEQAAIREVGEETGLNTKKLRLIKEVGVLSLSLHNEEKGNLDKDITYFLVEYTGKPSDVKIDKVEGYLGYYKWASMDEVQSLVYYEDLRKIIRHANELVVGNKGNGKGKLSKNMKNKH